MTSTPTNQPTLFLVRLAVNGLSRRRAAYPAKPIGPDMAGEA